MTEPTVPEAVSKSGGCLCAESMAGRFLLCAGSDEQLPDDCRTAAGFPASFFRDRGQQPDPVFFRQAGGQHVDRYFRQKEHRPDQRQAAAPDGTKRTLKNPLTED